MPDEARKTMKDIEIRRSAEFSRCRTWRYTLVREWDDDLPRLLFILLNPSTADEEKDDPTNRRGIQYAIDWGYGACTFCNLFAFRTPYPKEMKAAPDPVGPANDATIKWHYENADLVVAAWGADGSHRGRDRQVYGLLPDLQCLGMTKAGHPKHILYLKSDEKPRPWIPAKFSAPKKPVQDNVIKNTKLMNCTRGKNWHVVFQMRDKKNEDKILSELKFELRGVWTQDLPFSIKNWLRRNKIKGFIMPPSWEYEKGNLVFRTVTKVAHALITESLYQE